MWLPSNLHGEATNPRLRAEFESGDTTPTPDKYLDLSYDQRALSSVN
jgi:hypothetical protein